LVFQLGSKEVLVNRRLRGYFRRPRDHRAAVPRGAHSMRKRSSFIRVHGKEEGEKLYRLLQREANLASQIAKLKKRLAAAAGTFETAFETTRTRA
jgi:hypothetical protein